MSFETYDIHSHSGIQKNNIFDEGVDGLRKNSIPELLENYKDRIDKIVNFPMPGTVYLNYDDNNINNRQGSYPYEIENNELIMAVEKYDKKGKILPFLCINPKINVTEQLEGLFKLLRNNKFFGLKFHTLDTGASVDDLFSDSEIISFCREFKLPIIIHSGNFNNVEDCNNIFQHANNNKDLNFCIAHLMTFSKEFFRKMDKYQNNNIYTDMSPFFGLCKYVKKINPSGVLNLDYGNPAEVIENLFDKYSKFILWGSDEPFGDFKIDDGLSANYSLEDEIDFLFSLDKNTRKTIASDNSKRFLFNE